jgi:hypothetical protein
MIQLLAYGNSIKKYEEDILHRYKYSEHSTGSHQLVRSVTDSLITSSTDTIALNTSLNVTINFNMAPNFNAPEDIDITKPRATISVGYELLNNPTGVYVVGGPSMKIVSENIPLYADAGLTLVVGMITYSYPSLTGQNIPEFGFFVPDEGAFGILDTTNTLVASSTNNIGTIHLTGCIPVYYNNINGQPMTGNYVIIGYRGFNTTVQLAGLGLSTYYCLLPMVFTPTYVGLNRIMTTDTVTVIGNIVNNVVNVAGTNLPTVYSNVVITEDDLATLKAAIVTLANNDIALALALDELSTTMGSAMNALQASINDLRDKIEGSGFDAHSVVSSVQGILEILIAVIPNTTVKAGLLALSQVISVGQTLYSFYQTSIKLISGPEGQVLSFTQGLTSLVNKMRFVNYTTTQFKTIILNLNNRLGNTQFKWTRWRHYVLDLEALGVFSKQLSVLSGWPTEVLFKQNIYPKHSFVVVNEVVSDNYEGVGRWICYNRHDTIDSIAEVNPLSRASSFIFEWEGTWDEAPNGLIAAINGRDMYELDEGAATCDFEDVVEIMQYVKNTVGPYDLLFNNCHTAVDIVVEYMKNGVIANQYANDNIFGTDYDYS